MRRASGIRGRLGLACLVASLATAVVAGTAGAATSGTVTVSGTTVSVIELTVGDSTAQFGTNLAPDGTASNSSDTVTAYLEGSTPSVGACYKWGGNVLVRSNSPYRLRVSASTTVARLGFLTANPGTYTACSTGETVSATPAMFASATPVGTWATGLPRTTGATTSFWLGMTVQWTDATGPFSTVLTLSAEATS